MVVEAIRSSTRLPEVFSRLRKELPGRACRPERVGLSPTGSDLTMIGRQGP